jgi:hypothetical protein
MADLKHSEALIANPVTTPDGDEIIPLSQQTSTDPDPKVYVDAAITAANLKAWINA